MSEIDCQETKKHVHEYLHNELSEQELQDITSHLANCDSCEADYDLESTINNKIEQHCAEVPSEELLDGIKGRLQQILRGEAH